MFEGLDSEIKVKIVLCADEIIKTLDKYFHEFRESWNSRDPGQFENRVLMTLYLEMIHAGFFNKESENEQNIRK